MRGKAYEVVVATGEGRITPAYAGKRRATPLNRFQQWDHPRLCGENVVGGVSCVTTWGSPPPMRGKVHFFSLPRFFTRITPAYAGNRDRPVGTAAVLQDHPRLCGEKRRFASLWLPVVGSPPPMRGKVFEL